MKSLSVNDLGSILRMSLHLLISFLTWERRLLCIHRRWYFEEDVTRERFKWQNTFVLSSTTIRLNKISHVQTRRVHALVTNIYCTAKITNKADYCDRWAIKAETRLSFSQKCHSSSPSITSSDYSQSTVCLKCKLHHTASYVSVNRWMYGVCTVLEY